MKFILWVLVISIICNCCTATTKSNKFLVEYSAIKNKEKTKDIGETYTYYKINNLLVYVMEKYAFDSTILAKDPEEINESDFRKSKKEVLGHFIYDIKGHIKKGLVLPINAACYPLDIDSFFYSNGINSQNDEDNFDKLILVVQEQLPNKDIVRKYVRKDQQYNKGFADSLLVFSNKKFKDLSYTVLEGRYTLEDQPIYKTQHIGFIQDRNNQKNENSFYTVTVEMVRQSITNAELKTIRKLQKDYERFFN